MVYRFICFFVLILSNLSFASDVYVIKNIKIYGNNKVASQARNQAIEDGQIKAFKGLAKLHYPDALNKLNTIEKDDIFSLVEGFELSEEKRSATNYYAKLKVKFSRAHVDKFMKNIGVDFLEKEKPNIQEFDQTENDWQSHNEIQKNPLVVQKKFVTLAIPIFIENKKEIWFDSDNLWLDVWQKNNQENKFVLPVVDLEDLKLINKNIFKKNVIDLTPLFEKYNVNNIALYIIEDVEQGDVHRLKFKVNYLNKYLYSWQKYHFRDQDGRDLSSLLEQAYIEAQNFTFDSNLDMCCNITDEFLSIKPEKFIINLEVNNISQWLVLEQYLKNSNYVSDVQLENITLGSYNFSLISNISLNDLKKMFSKRGFDLKQENQQFYLLQNELIKEEENLYEE